MCVSGRGEGEYTFSEQAWEEADDMERIKKLES